MTEINAKRTVFINSLFTTFQTVIDKFLFFVINMLIARYLEPALFGEYTTSLAYATLFSTFADIGIRSTLVRSISKDRSNKDRHITNAFLLTTAMSVIVYAAMAVSLFFMNYSVSVIQLILVFGFVRIGNEYMNLFYAIYSAQERFIVQAVNNSMFSLALLITTIIIILVRGTIFDFAYSRFAIVTLFIILLAFYTMREVKLKLSIEAMKEFIPQAYHFGMSTIYENLLQRANIIILSYMHGTIYSGFFANSYMIFTTLFFIPYNLNRVLVAHLYKFSYSEEPEKFQFAFDIYSKVFDIISVGITLIIFLFSDEIIVLIYGKNYLPAAGILKITVLAIPMLFNVSGLLLTAIDRQDARVKCQGYALLVNIISNLVLIKYYRGIGAAWATVITYFTLTQLYNITLVRLTSVNYLRSLAERFKVILIALLLVLFKYKLPVNIHFIPYMAILGLVYLILIYVSIINKKDMEIAREIFGKIIPQKKYIFFG